MVELVNRTLLIADEVRLGKTLVAKGLISKSLDHLDRAGMGRIDVVRVL